MQKKYPTSREMLSAIKYALTAPEGFEKKAGQCKRFCRQVAGYAGVPLRDRPPVIIDAKQCADWYRKNRSELCRFNGSVPGDLLFWENGHGEHGHVAWRLPDNEIGENSTAHAPEGHIDGRGTRSLDGMKEPSLIVRLWRNQS